MTHQFTTQTVNCHNIAVGVKALQQGGFTAWYDAQVELFTSDHSNLKSSSYPSFANRTQRARRPLEYRQDLLHYNVLYAGDHFARLTTLLSQLRENGNPQAVCLEPIQLKVFDYGCGQGLASLALMQHLAGRQVSIELHLVEPSALALQAAVAYTQAQAQHHAIQLQVHAHHCGLDQLSNELFTLQPQQSAVHLFSNVLDLAVDGVFDLNVLLEQIKKMSGKQLCLAVSPNYPEGRLGFLQLLDGLPTQRFSSAKYLVNTDNLVTQALSFRLTSGSIQMYTPKRACAVALQFRVA
ncbi:MAG: hypothetical protein ACEQSD_02265 [Flavobacteriales bacterium]